MESKCNTVTVHNMVVSVCKEHGILVTECENAALRKRVEEIGQLRETCQMLLPIFSEGSLGRIWLLSDKGSNKDLKIIIRAILAALSTPPKQPEREGKCHIDDEGCCVTHGSEYGGQDHCPKRPT